MRTAKDISFTITTMVVPLLVGVITVPFYLEIIGVERYGALAIAWLVLGYFGQADFGIGRSVTQRIGSMDEDDRFGPSAAHVLSSALLLGLPIGIAGATVTYFGTELFINRGFKIDAVLREEFNSALFALALSSPLMVVSGIGLGAIGGAQRFRLLAIFNMLSMLSLQAAPLAAAILIKPNLTILITAALAARILVLIPLAFFIWRSFLFKNPKGTSAREAKRLASFGIWAMVSTLIGPLMVISDRFVIGALIGAAAVAVYTIPFQVASRIMVIPAAIMQVLFPKFASANAGQVIEQARMSMILVGCIFAGPIIFLVALAEPLLTVWIGDNLDQRSILIGQIVLIGFWTNGIAQIPFNMIQARGNTRFTGFLHIIEFPFYFGLLMGLGVTFGLIGMAAAFAMRCALDGAILAAKARLWTGMVAIRLALPAILIVGAMVGGSLLTDIWHLFAATGMLLLLWILWVWFILPIKVKQWLLQVSPVPDWLRRRIANERTSP